MKGRVSSPLGINLNKPQELKKGISRIYLMNDVTQNEHKVKRDIKLTILENSNELIAIAKPIACDSSAKGERQAKGWTSPPLGAPLTPDVGTLTLTLCKVS